MTRFIFIFSFTLLFYKISSGQYNPYTNSTDLFIHDSVTSKSVSRIGSTSVSSGLTCNQGYFYGISPTTGIIDRLILNNNTVQLDSANFLTSNNMSLAFSNDLAGGPFSPTFYSDDPATSTNAPESWDGSGWITNTPGYPIPLYNCGGFENYLYFSGTPSYITSVVRYTGSSYSVVYQCTGTTKISVGDLAVDNAGNVYFLISTNFSSMISDSLLVVSPNGQILQQVAFQINFNHSYGAFMMNGVYYIAFGSTNVVNPNTLLPIIISQNSAVAGTPISNPWSTYVDLASCDPGIPQSIKNHSLQTDFTVNPNPASEMISVNFPSSHFDLLRIYGLDGKLIYEKKLADSDLSAEINLNFLNSGIYFMQLEGNQIISRKKFLKF